MDGAPAIEGPASPPPAERFFLGLRSSFSRPSSAGAVVEEVAPNANPAGGAGEGAEGAPKPPPAGVGAGTDEPPPNVKPGLGATSFFGSSAGADGAVAAVPKAKTGLGGASSFFTSVAGVVPPNPNPPAAAGAGAGAAEAEPKPPKTGTGIFFFLSPPPSEASLSAWHIKHLRIQAALEAPHLHFHPSVTVVSSFLAAGAGAAFVVAKANPPVAAGAGAVAPVPNENPPVAGTAGVLASSSFFLDSLSSSFLPKEKPPAAGAGAAAVAANVNPPAGAGAGADVSGAAGAGADAPNENPPVPIAAAGAGAAAAVSAAGAGADAPNEKPPAPIATAGAGAAASLAPPSAAGVAPGFTASHARHFSLSDASFMPRHWSHRHCPGWSEKRPPHDPVYFLVTSPPEGGGGAGMSSSAAGGAATVTAGGPAACFWAAAVLRALSRMVSPPDPADEADAAAGDEYGKPPPSLVPFLGWGVPFALLGFLPSTLLILCFFRYSRGLSISSSKSQSTFFWPTADGAAASTPDRSMATSARTASVISSAGTGLDGVKA
mmetsp:Transcript_31981/g.94070  ORF Transcript_31981/g.94070 Transcript_31981/m.94070 type:complete len:547 (-) Transcript_31981:1488-3128(-)